MRKLLLTAAGLALAVIAGQTPAQASADLPWCASGGFRSGGAGQQCNFVSFQQCQAYISGIGGTCNPNYAGYGARVHYAVPVEPVYVGPRRPRVRYFYYE